MKIAEPRQYPCNSVFADIFNEYVELNRAVGKKFDAEASAVWRFDRWCVDPSGAKRALTRKIRIIALE